MKSSSKRPDVPASDLHAVPPLRSEIDEAVPSPSPPTIRAIFTEAELEKVKAYSTRLPPRPRHIRRLPSPPGPTDEQRAERESARALHRALLDLGATLRRRREHLGLSLEAVAQRCGINRAALSKLELGQNPNPTFETLWRYAAALGKQIECALTASSGPAHENEVAGGAKT